MADHEQQRLGQVLVELGLVEEPQLPALLRETTRDKRLGRILVDRGLVTEDRLIAQLSKHLGLETIDPESTPVHDRVLKLIPPEIARRHRVIPIARRKEKGEESLFLATADPFDDQAERALHDLMPDISFRYFLSSEQEITLALDRHYPNAERDREVVKVRTGGSAAIEVALSAPMDGHDAATQVDQERIGRYDLVERIGVDATAELFLTDQSTSDGRRLVLRRPLPKLPKNEKTRKKFFGDAEKCVGLKHPHIVEVQEVAARGTQWYVVQEHVDGVDLNRLFPKARKLKLRLHQKAALYTAAKIADAIDYAHSTRDSDGKALRLLHHGLSPASVLVTEEGHVKVHGFGLEDAAVVKRSDHAAPEQIDGGTIDERTVVFRAGLIMYELLAGVPLFEEGVTTQEMEKALGGVGRSLAQHCPDASPEVEKVLVRALSFDREQRYASARELGSALQLILGSDANPRLPVDLGRFVRSVLGHGEDSSDYPRVREEPMVPALRNASDRVEKLVDRASPRIKQLTKQSGERIARALERFGAWFAGAPRSQQLATILIPIAVVIGTIIGVVARDDRVETTPITVDVGEEDAAAAYAPPPPDPNLYPPKDGDPPKVTILPGISDMAAPSGTSYIAVEGAELRATNEEEGEVLLWMEAGKLVERIRSMPGGQVLVMIPPKGPVGFISADALAHLKPIEALGKEIGFKGCKVDARKPLEDCLIKAKEQTDACLVRCQKHSPTSGSGGRCTQACQAAFDRCARQCNDTKVSFDEEAERQAARRKTVKRKR